MNCLILAAGYGSRLRAVSESKPLTLVGGVPLIEHVIHSAAAAGARSFTIVTGHEAQRVETFVAALAPRLDVAIRSVRLDDWSRPNGYSVIAGAEAIGGDYLLLMSDHLFDPAIARKLLAAPERGAVTLAVDRNITDPMLDLDDATKVEVAADGAIVRIGKEIPFYNAIDTGIFRATPALADALRLANAEGGNGSLSSGVQRLAGEGLAHTIDTGGEWWLDVDDPRSHVLAEEALAAPADLIRDNAA